MRGNYEVGYGKPPQHTQFKKGQSGNPKGRLKGTKNFRTDLREELDEPVTVREGEFVRTMSSQRAALKRLRAKALEGDQRALDRLLGLAERHDFEEAADAEEAELSGEDQSIIDRFLERALQEHAAEAAAQDDTNDKENRE
jgi:DNA-binding MurR/RpiR family transcriptional regulator